MELEQTIAIASVTWRVNDSLQLTGGALYSDIAATLSLSGPNNERQLTVGDDWIDPVVGVLLKRRSARLGSSLAQPRLAVLE